MLSNKIFFEGLFSTYWWGCDIITDALLFSILFVISYVIGVLYPYYCTSNPLEQRRLIKLGVLILVISFIVIFTNVPRELVYLLFMEDMLTIQSWFLVKFYCQWDSVFDLIFIVIWGSVCALRKTQRLTSITVEGACYFIICFLLAYVYTLPTYFCVWGEILLFAYFSLIFFFSLLHGNHYFKTVIYWVNLLVNVLLVLFSLQLYYSADVITCIFYPTLSCTKITCLIQIVFVAFLFAFNIITRLGFSTFITFRWTEEDYTLFFISFSLIGLLLIKSNSSIFMWLLIEMLTLVSYAFLAIALSFTFYWVLVYLIVNSLAGSLILYGFTITGWDSSFTSIIFLDSVLGTVNPSPVLNLGLSLVLLGLLIKLGSVPFHLWVLGIYPQLRFDLYMLFLILNKGLLLVVLYKVLFFSLQFNSLPLQLFLLLFAVGGSIVGSYLLVYEKNFMRFFTLASLVQTSFICVVWSCFTKEALIIGLVYLVSYLALLLGFYAVCSLLILQDGSPKWWVMKFSVKEVFAYSWQVGSLFLFFLFAFIGLPPFLLFIVKLHSFIILLSTGYQILLVSMLLLNGLTCIYYIFFILFTTSGSFNSFYEALHVDYWAVREVPDAAGYNESAYIYGKVIEKAYPLVDEAFKLSFTELPLWTQQVIIDYIRGKDLAVRAYSLILISFNMFSITFVLQLEYGEAIANLFLML